MCRSLEAHKFTNLACTRFPLKFPNGPLCVKCEFIRSPYEILFSFEAVSALAVPRSLLRSPSISPYTLLSSLRLSHESLSREPE